MLANRIRFINMESIFDNLCDLGVEEKQAENICVGLEDNEEFRKLFFFTDREHHEYFYQHSEETQIKEYLGQYMEVNRLPNYCFRDLGNELLENCDSENDIEIGIVKINEEDFYIVLNEETLEIDEYINQLVTAKDFYEELKKVKKSNLEYLFSMEVERAREKLKDFEFKR